MKKIIKKYRLGDMCVWYWWKEDGTQAEMLLLPADMVADPSRLSDRHLDSMVQLKLAGDIYNDTYAMGMTMRNSETVRRLIVADQTVTTKDTDYPCTEICTYLKDSRGYEVIHRLTHRDGAAYVTAACEFRNNSDRQVSLELLESFSLSGITPALYSTDTCDKERMRLHRLRSVWSMEGRLESIPVEELQLETAWEPHAVRCEKYGQAGSMPVNRYFPFAALEDEQNHILWGAQIAHPASWQIELYRKEEALALSGGLADRDFGSWLKHIGPGESFRSPTAILTVCRAEVQGTAWTDNTHSIDLLTGRLVRYAETTLRNAPVQERKLPIIFNEYCTTWGNPSHENICRILDTVKNRGFDYFVIDCGWFKDRETSWEVSMGDYRPSEELFPKGLKYTADTIRKAGMVPGIWFEIETVGKESKAYQNTEHLLKKDGVPLTSYARRFWDMTDPWVQEDLAEKVIGTLKENGFGYIKIDYNETIGTGCDGAESLGEALRKNMEASAEFFRKIRQEVPGIIMENCASGGHRLEPSLMALTDMASFSDAHECREIPIIAANLHRAIHPAQSQIWAVIRKTDSLPRIVYSISAAFLGRMCLSGDVTELSEKQWQTIEKGMAFYKKAVPIIQNGQSFRFGTEPRSYRKPEGWQGLLRVGQNGQAMLVFHTFGGEIPNVIRVSLNGYLPGGTCRILSVYACQEKCVRLEGEEVIYEPSDSFEAAALLLG